MTKSLFLSLLIIFSIVNFINANSLNILTDKFDPTIKQIFKDYEEKTGIRISVNEIDRNIFKKIENSNVDLILTNNSSKIITAKFIGLLQPINDNILSNVDVKYKDIDKQWLNISYRLRTFFVQKDESIYPTTYKELSNSQYKDKICVRNLYHSDNLDLFTHLFINMGKKKFKKWFNGFKSNLSMNPIGDDTTQFKYIYNNKCKIAISNTNTYGLLFENTEQKKLVKNTFLILPEQFSNKKLEGIIPIYSGIGISKKSNNVKESNDFISYLLSEEVQQKLIDFNFEHSVTLSNNSKVFKSFGLKQNIVFKDISINHFNQNNITDLKSKVYQIIN